VGGYNSECTSGGAMNEGRPTSRPSFGGRRAIACGICLGTLVMMPGTLEARQSRASAPAPITKAATAPADASAHSATVSKYCVTCPHDDASRVFRPAATSRGR
jgi:hypothetical protein